MSLAFAVLVSASGRCRPKLGARRRGPRGAVRTGAVYTNSGRTRKGASRATSAAVRGSAQPQAPLGGQAGIVGVEPRVVVAEQVEEALRERTLDRVELVERLPELAGRDRLAQEAEPEVQRGERVVVAARCTRGPTRVRPSPRCSEASVS